MNAEAQAAELTVEEASKPSLDPQFKALYQPAYEDCCTAMSTVNAPGCVVPADDKENTRLLLSLGVLHSADDLKMTYPNLDKVQRKELQSIRKLLEK